MKDYSVTDLFDDKLFCYRLVICVNVATKHVRQIYIQ